MHCLCCSAVCVCDCIGCQWDTVCVLRVVALAALEEMYSSLIKFAVNTYKCVCVRAFVKTGSE